MGFLGYILMFLDFVKAMWLNCNNQERANYKYTVYTMHKPCLPFPSKGKGERGIGEEDVFRHMEGDWLGGYSGVTRMIDGQCQTSPILLACEIKGSIT